MRHRRAPCLVLLLGLAACGGSYDLPALASTTSPSIRVLLLQKRGEIAVPAGAWQITSLSGRAFARSGRGPMRLLAGANASGVLLGREETGATSLKLETESPFTLDGLRYPGDLVLDVAEGQLRLINVTDMETYVAGVIPNEMAPGAPPAAYRAQAVAARTYGWMQILARGPSSAFHVYDSQSSQVYTGLSPRYDVSYPDMVRRTEETAGVILTWQNRPFHAYYASTCGGHTTNPETSNLDGGGATEPLRGVRCEFCTSSPKYEWSVTFTDQDLVDGLARRRRPITAPVRAIRVGKRGPGGWAQEVIVTYGPDAKERTVPGTEFRSALRLNSHMIVGLAHEGGRWVLQGRGWGHGVGLCQWGAFEMARRGMSESEILRWYYPGVAFAKLY